MTNRLTALLFICIIIITSCKPVEEKVTKDEAIKFIDEIEAGIAKRKPDFLTSTIIVPALVKRIEKSKNINISGEVEKGMRSGLSKNQLDKNLFQMIGKKGSLEKVKLYQKDGNQRVIFRAFGDEGINYLDIELTKLNDRVGIADIFLYASGENISKTMSELYDNIMKGPESEVKPLTDKLQSVKLLLAKANYKQAKIEFERLPYSFKETKVADVLYLQILSNLDEDAYVKAIEKFEVKYKGDPGIQLTLLDMYILHEEYDKALTAINELDAMIDKDPFLDYFRGLMNNAKGDSEKAIGYYQKVTEKYPAFPGAYAELFAHYTANNDKEKAKEYFIKYKNLPRASEDIISLYEDSYPYLAEK